MRWRNAAIWKWCDLDGEPSDSSISRHELFPIKAPLQVHLITINYDNIIIFINLKLILRALSTASETSLTPAIPIRITRSL